MKYSPLRLRLRMQHTPLLAAVVVLLAASCAMQPAGFKAAHSAKSNAIVGGTSTTIGARPFQVALESKSEGDFFFCGGSVIDAEWVLTAQHCMEGPETASDLQVVAG